MVRSDQKRHMQRSKRKLNEKLKTQWASRIKSTTHRRKIPSIKPSKPPSLPESRDARPDNS